MKKNRGWKSHETVSLKGMGAKYCFCELSHGVIKNPEVSLTLQDLIPPYQWHRGIWSRRILDTAGFDPAVSWTQRDRIQGGSLTPGDRIPQCQWHRWIRFHCLIETMESFTKMFWSRCIIDTKESDNDTAESELFSENSKQYVKRL
jgi:hypothetical protein